MDNCVCAHFLCCNSGEGLYSNSNADNFLTYSVDQCGVSYAIGYDGAVKCDYGESFLSLFSGFLEQGSSLYPAVILALDELKNDSIPVCYNRIVVVTTNSISKIDPLTEERITEFR